MQLHHIASVNENNKNKQIRKMKIFNVAKPLTSVVRKSNFITFITAYFFYTAKCF